MLKSRKIYLTTGKWTVDIKSREYKAEDIAQGTCTYHVVRPWVQPQKEEEEEKRCLSEPYETSYLRGHVILAMCHYLLARYGSSPL